MNNSIELTRCGRCQENDAVTTRGGMPLCGPCTVEVELAREAFLRGVDQRCFDYPTMTQQAEANYRLWCQAFMLDPEDVGSATEYEVWYSDFYS
jgi:ferredoxin